MSKFNGINKHCPGCCEPGETLPVQEFRRDKTRNDGRAELCISCEEMKFEKTSLHEPVPKQAVPPVAEKKRRGCQPGGWPKKNSPDSAKPCTEIQTNKPESTPEPGASKNTPLKFDLSTFEKITTERRIPEKPMIRIGKDNEVAFLMQAVKFFRLDKCQSLDVYVNRGTSKSQIAFCPMPGDYGSIKLHSLPSYCYFNSVVAMRKMGIKPGKYEITECGGRLFIEAPNMER